MHKVKSLIFSSAVFSSQMGLARTEIVSPQGLENFGLDANRVAKEFQQQAGIDIDLNQPLKVSGANEGTDIRFETLDRISIVVPFERVSGPANKDAGL